MRSRRIRDAEGVVHGRTKVIRTTPCGKRGYTSRKIAASAAARARRLSGHPIEVYHCADGCHCLHIGHPPGWKFTDGQAIVASDAQALP